MPLVIGRCRLSFALPAIFNPTASRMVEGSAAVPAGTAAVRGGAMRLRPGRAAAPFSPPHPPPSPFRHSTDLENADPEIGYNRQIRGQIPVGAARPTGEIRHVPLRTKPPTDACRAAFQGKGIR